MIDNNFMEKLSNKYNFLKDGGDAWEQEKDKAKEESCQEGTKKGKKD